LGILLYLKMTLKLNVISTELKLWLFVETQVLNFAVTWTAHQHVRLQNYGCSVNVSFVII